MLTGRRRESETDAVYSAAKFLKLYSACAPEDIALRQCARRAAMCAMMMISQDLATLASPGQGQSDCEWCDGNPPCTPCKYDTPAMRRQAIRQHLGVDALGYLERYEREREEDQR